MTIEDRLEEMGLALPQPPKPVAAYIPAVASGGLIFTSGQLPLVEGKLLASGLVGDKEGHVDPDAAAGLAQTAALNALAAIKSEIGSLERVRRIVKVVGYVASDSSFTGQPSVVNGASELLGKLFGDAGQHARSAVGVAALPLGAPVEVEIIAEFA